MSLQTGERGTIKPQAHFDAGDDAVALRKAIEGLGTKEKTLIDILTHRSSAQRQLICEAYVEATGRTLVDDLRGDTSGDLEALLVALATPPAAFDCHEVMRAMKGAGTTESILIEIFASRSNQKIYLYLYIFSPTQTLYDAGEKKWGTDESKFVDILCQRSVPQLRQTLVEYKNISGKTLQQSIEGEMTGELEELLVAIVKCVKSMPTYFAERLHESMKGGGTDESSLNRIMVSRSEIDLLDIRAEFKKLYEYSLHSAIKSDLSGVLGDCVEAICGGDD
uniref:Annexin n=1 Tax=Cyclopterus lumpus TaxID=8103 RepID=A0A8C2XLW0_CYCLU